MRGEIGGSETGKRGEGRGGRGEGGPTGALTRRRWVTVPQKGKGKGQVCTRYGRHSVSALLCVIRRLTEDPGPGEAPTRRPLLGGVGPGEASCN